MMQFELSDDEPELVTLDISNDQYYLPLSDRSSQVLELKEPHATKLQIPKYGSRTIRHSLPAYDLWKAFFPTYLSDIKFHNFHRPKLRHYNNGPQARDQWGRYRYHPIKNLSRNIFRVHMLLKNRVIKAINDGMSREDIISKFLLLKHAKELSAKDGELYLFEYSEEFPPVLSQVGMASNVKTYTYRPGPVKSQPKELNFQTSKSDTQNQSSDQALAKTTFGYEEALKTDRQAKMIYYNALKPNSRTRFIENNLYRAPIFEHELPSCDFLVIRTRNNYYIREVKTIFTVGQLLPLTVVPAPNESYIQKFRCDLSNVYIHKLFKASTTDPPSLSLDKLMKLFPDYHRSIVYKRMHNSGVKTRYIHNEQVIIQGESKYGQLSTLELRNFMRPESYCLNMSMLASRQRLRELNYSETMIFPDKGQSVELEPEVLAAPWNTTKAVVSAMNNRSYLDLERHLIDPTGPAREGFSCVTWVKSPTEVEQSKEMMSGSKANTATPITFEKNPLQPKITQEKLRRLAIYSKEAQQMAELQSKSLSNQECLSSCEEESDVDMDNENLLESDFSQQLSDLSRLIIGGRSVNELTHEKEEEERRQMLADLRLNGVQDEKQPSAETSKKYDDRHLTLALLKNKILMITRTYEQNGARFQRTEIVREPRIMALYVEKRGGSLTNKISETGDNHDDQSLANDQNNTSTVSNKSDGGSILNQSRSRSLSLGPSELCRTDGTRIRISKKVLDHVRPMRNLHRQSSID
uniref:Transcription initiation factor TFIID subunit 1-like n=1 Tax=Aceria tosichella TaxID=561515 RepID=A0A6G1SHA3_9ACAR